MRTVLEQARELSIGISTGHRGRDGRFEEDPFGGRKWLIFDNPQDRVFWNPTINEIATDFGRAFALGEEQIDNAATYALDDWLHIHGSVASWVRAGGRGIFVVDWRKAFDRLRYCPRIEIPETLQAVYRRAMDPPRPRTRIKRILCRSEAA